MKNYLFIKVFVVWVLIVNGDLFSAAQDDYSKDIFTAVKADDLDTVTDLLECKADVNQKDSSGNSLLFYSVTKKNTKMAELLLRSNALINSSDNYGLSTPLHRAALTPNASMVKFLLDQNADVNSSSETSSVMPLDCAAERSTSEVVALLLERKANPNHKGHSYSLFKAVETANFADKNYFLNGKASDDKIKTIELLIEGGADPNVSRYQEGSPFSIANQRIREVMVAAIAKKKASDAAMRDQLAAQEEKE